MIISTGVDLPRSTVFKQRWKIRASAGVFAIRVHRERDRLLRKKMRGKYESYAGRFAAKEAVMKALGRGWGAKVRWLDIEVARARSGKPEIVLHDKTARLAEELKIRRWALSITHTKVMV